MKNNNIAVFCGSEVGNNPIYKTEMVALGHHLAFNGFNLIFGCGQIGLMGAVASSMLMAGGNCHGVINKDLCTKEIIHDGVTSSSIVEDMYERKRELFKLASAFIIAPGSVGTIDEGIEVLVHKQLGYHKKPIIFLNIHSYWYSLLNLIEDMKYEGFLNNIDGLYDVVYNSEEAVNLLKVYRSCES
jgi:uncharacterized protein (TIGR00730 family)